MAKNDKNRDKEDDFFGDDDDFGLPELDFEALEDDDSEGSFNDLEINDESFDDEVLADESEDLEYLNMDDSLGDGEDVVGDEPDAKKEISKGNTLKEAGSFQEKDPFDDLSLDDDGDYDSDLNDEVFEDEEFKEFEKGLMESESGELGGFVQDDNDDDEKESSASESGNKGNFTKVVIIGIALFTALAIGFWQLSPDYSSKENEQLAEKNVNQPNEDATKESEITENTTEEEAQSNEPTTNSEENSQKTEVKAGSDNTKGETVAKSQSLANTKPENPGVGSTGQINALTERTNNYYIIIASFLDRDLAVDHSSKLAAQGKTLFIIPPFDNAITYRVGIKNYRSLDQAKSAIDGYRADYGRDAWILKY